MFVNVWYSLFTLRPYFLPGFMYLSDFIQAFVFQENFTILAK